MSGKIHIGIGGWTYEPWRGTFYPPGLAQARELEYAGNAVTAIEVNGTYYRSQSPASFEKWAKAVPSGFVFTLKASRFCTNRKNLAEAGESIAKFVGQGLIMLGEKLGPILWQFMPTKRFDPDEISTFLSLLPDSYEGVPLRHAIEPRHESFRDSAFTALTRNAGAAIVLADSATHPQIADITADFIYARLQNAREEEPTGYSPAEIDRWADAARAWSSGDQPPCLSYVDEAPAPAKPRETFLFMINGAKVRAPAAAQALIARLSEQ
jgi:uncharacterized protein YecE (DUF72 family)